MGIFRKCSVLVEHGCREVWRFRIVGYVRWKESNIMVSDDHDCPIVVDAG